MKLKFSLNNDEIWAACLDIYAGAIFLNKGSGITFVYFVSWGFFWLAILASLALAYGDQCILFKHHVPELLLAGAFLAFYIFNRYAENFSLENFKSLTKGKEGIHQLELEEETICFETPSGKLEISYTDIVSLVAINKHLLIYTAIWSCYIPLEKFEKPLLNQVANLLQEKTSLILVNCIENE